MAWAMEQALAEAGIDKTAIGYVAAHATSTPLGDLAEARAIARVFGNHAPSLHVNALKSMLGHLMASSVLVETVAAVLQLRSGWLYPSINIDRLDPDIGLAVCANRAVPCRVDALMKNAFGFGGVNTACVLARVRRGAGRRSALVALTLQQERKSRMNREELLGLLVNNLKKAVPEFADEDLDTSKTYKELGVSSLELVEVVTRTTKELRLTLPFQELAKVRNTDDLADVILRLQQGA